MAICFLVCISPMQKHGRSRRLSQVPSTLQCVWSKRAQLWPPTPADWVVPEVPTTDDRLWPISRQSPKLSCCVCAGSHHVLSSPIQRRQLKYDPTQVKHDGTHPSIQEAKSGDSQGQGQPDYIVSSILIWVIYTRPHWANGTLPGKPVLCDFSSYKEICVPLQPWDPKEGLATRIQTENNWKLRVYRN